MGTKPLIGLLLTAGLTLLLNQGTLAQDEVLDPSLVGLWHFEEPEGDLLEDSSGYFNHGIVHGAPTRVDGIAGSGFRLDGVNDYISFVASRSLVDITGAVTLEAWIKPERLGHIMGIPYWKISGGGASVYVPTRGPIGEPSGGQAVSTNIPPGEWRHVAMTYDGNMLKFYLDGEVKDTNANPKGDLPIIPYDEFSIGAYFNKSNFFKGVIDEARVYRRALSAEEIKRHYKSNGRGPDFLGSVRGDKFFSLDLTNVSGWKLGAHRDGKTLSRVSQEDVDVSNEVKYEGRPSLGLHYCFSTSGEDAAFVTKEVNIQGTKDSVLVLAVYGDKSCNTLFVVLEDSTGESHFLKLGKLFWEGWKTLPVGLSLLATPPAKGTVDGYHWGGDENQILDYPIRAITVGLSDGKDDLNGKGDIFLGELGISQAAKTETSLKQTRTSQAAKAKTSLKQTGTSQAAKAETSPRQIGTSQAAKAETSLTAPETMRIPESWNYIDIAGKPFYLLLNMSFCLDACKKIGLSEDEPFIKDAALFITTGFLKNAGATAYKKLLSMNNPVIIRGGGSPIDGTAFARFNKDFGSRYIATSWPGMSGEWTWMCDPPGVWGHVPGVLGIDVPKNRKEAHEALLKYYITGEASKTFKAAPGHKIWSIQATFQSHCDSALEEVAIASPEIGYGMTAMQLAFARGASRQYQKPWASYIACYRGDGPTCYVNHILSPRCSFFWHAQRSPRSGTSVSLQRRQLYYSYMSGANIIKHESEGEPFNSIFLANYDFRTIDKIDPLVLLLRDEKQAGYRSPVLAAWKEFYDRIAAKHDRGIPYTPVALLFDQYHGCTFSCYGSTADSIFGLFPFDDSDYMMRAAIKTLSGWGTGGRPDCEHVRHEEHVMPTNPFGDIFDCVTNTASLETLKGYRAIFAVGRVDMDGAFAKKLIQYVKEGGTLLINTRQLVAPLSLPSFLGVELTKERLEGEGFVSLLDGTSRKEDKPFSFDVVRPTAASTLVKALGSQPLVTSNRYGKGRVVLTTPHYLYAKGTKDKMLKLFSHLLGELNGELTPADVSGDVQYMFNRNKRGWVITLINNRGVYKELRKAPVVKPEERVAVKITLRKNIRVEGVDEWVTGESPRLSTDGGRTSAEVVVPAGDVRILEFSCSSLVPQTQ